jgi:AcrR family transcriptional regulator
MSPRPRKEEQQNLSEAIKETAWRQIAEAGAASLSLRAIARELGITAPAIYNYYPDRDALVTALIVDAYNSLADAQEAVDAGELGGQLSALGLAYRQWAVTYPQRYLLIFGTPIPNYHAPDDVTLPAATRALTPLIGALQALLVAGRLRVERLAAPTPGLESGLLAWSQTAGGVDPDALYLALAIWSRVHGLVMLEIGNHIPPFLDEPGAVFAREIQHIVGQYL